MTHFSMIGTMSVSSLRRAEPVPALRMPWVRCQQPRRWSERYRMTSNSDRRKS